MKQKISLANLALLPALIFFVCFAVVKAQIGQGGNYTLNQSVIAGGGGTSTNAGSIFTLEGTIGESIAGTTSTNSPFTVKGGFLTANPLAPTAATVSVGGQVLTTDGRGIRNVLITMTDQNGQLRTTLSSAFGYFSFAEVPSGETYIFTVTSKRFTFTQAAQIFSITEDTNDITFVGEMIARKGLK